MADAALKATQSMGTLSFHAQQDFASQTNFRASRRRFGMAGAGAQCYRRRTARDEFHELARGLRAPSTWRKLPRKVICMRLIARFFGFLFATGAISFVLGAMRRQRRWSTSTTRICRTIPS